MTEIKTYPLIIIGAGPAGLAASIYASRYGVKHIIVGELLGGLIAETHLIDNYPGIEDVTGFEFGQKLAHHAQKYGVEIMPGRVQKIFKAEADFEIELAGGGIISSKAILIATGTKHRKLGIKGEEEFLGKGVSYCATCDGFFYKNKTVAVVGGSDSAAGAAVYLSEICEKVYLIYRRKKLRAEDFWVNLVEKNSKIEVVYNTNIVEILGAEKVCEVQLDKIYKNAETLSVDGLFIEAGSVPSIDFAGGLELETDENGYIKIKSDSSTSTLGVWAAGDTTTGSDKFCQVITACAEGAIAARSISNYLKK
ncbi:MAG: FAD-dependent oxidoreductase [Parcubacteria group bacterium]|jgi:thioredoxin reductase (NADPH)